LQVSIAVFWGAVEKLFGQRWLSSLEKIGPYAYENSSDYCKRNATITTATFKFLMSEGLGSIAAAENL